MKNKLIDIYKKTRNKLINQNELYNFIEFYTKTNINFDNAILLYGQISNISPYAITQKKQENVNSKKYYIVDENKNIQNIYYIQNKQIVDNITNNINIKKEIYKKYINEDFKDKIRNKLTNNILKILFVKKYEITELLKKINVKEILKRELEKNGIKEIINIFRKFDDIKKISNEIINKMVIDNRKANISHTDITEAVELNRKSISTTKSIKVNREANIDHINSTETVTTNNNDKIIEIKNPTIVRPLSKNTIIPGSKKKYYYNIDAITFLKNIEKENKKPSSITELEKNILRSFSGWGGIPQAFDRNNIKWEKENKELKEILTRKEYDEAIASTLTSYYTPQYIIDFIYKFLEKSGYKKGDILEPSCGIGRFIKESKNYNFTGIEIDSIPARISKYINNNAKIINKAFEETHFEEEFDIAIGNVPFGNYTIYDKNIKFKNNQILIHDYFFLKSINLLKTNGIMIFITSKGTLDKKDNSFRKELSKKAELITAIRLPEETFKETGTRITTDIIIMRKREKEVDVNNNENWLDIDTDKGINKFFIDNPNMILGDIVYKSNQYGKEEPVCVMNKDDDMTLEEKLNNLANTFVYRDYIKPKSKIKPKKSVNKNKKIDIPEKIGNEINSEAYSIFDNQLIQRKETDFYIVDNKIKNYEILYKATEIKEIVKETIDMEIEEKDTKEIKKILNKKYDNFVSKYGYIKDNNKILSKDSEFYLIENLEKISSNGIVKSDIFTRDKIELKKNVYSINKPKDLLIKSLNDKGYVDLDYMMQIPQSSVDIKSKENLIEKLKGDIFFNPEISKYEEKEKYLSGNISKKIKEVNNYMLTHDMDLSGNIEMLEKNIPPKINMEDIIFGIESSWIDIKTKEKFIYDILQIDYSYRRYGKGYQARNQIIIIYNKATDTYKIANKSIQKSQIINETYGIDKKNALSIIEDTLNMKIVKVTKVEIVNGEEKRVEDTKRTILAQQKQIELKEKFKEYIINNKDLRDMYETKFNEKFNNYVNRKYEGSILTFEGMNKDIVLKKHQQNAIYRTLVSDCGTLINHAVGAGKTFVMIASIMEKKRLGQANKPMLVVPNHLTNQFKKEFLRLYPKAKILVADDETLSSNREKRASYIGRIITNEYDAIIIQASKFDLINISKEKKEEYIRNEIEILENLKSKSENNGTIKQIERKKKTLENKIKKLLDKNKKDEDIISFDKLGIDLLYIDESDRYKNAPTLTKMSNVSGVPSTESGRATDLILKINSITEKNSYNNILFASGTPVSNTMAEMYHLNKYLNPKILDELELSYFDSWASTFGEINNTVEIAPEGKGYTNKTRFSKFINLPELSKIFNTFTDTVTKEELNQIVKLPKEEKEVVVSEPCNFTKNKIEEFSERANLVRKGMVDRNVDNMLMITNEGRKLGVDPRLLDPSAPENLQSKINKCSENIYNIYKQYEPQKASQVVFSDIGVPNKNKNFNVYNEIKKKLIRKGIPKEEIGFIHDANNSNKKKGMFNKVDQGEIRVILGSTQKMGVGTNMQERLIALHHIDCPWKPSELTQREGRIVRQGNMFEKVKIFNYVTKGTFDAFIWQTVEKKQRFISQIFSNNIDVREAEDIDKKSLEYSDIKTAAVDNPYIEEKLRIENDIEKYKLLRNEHEKKKRELEEKEKELPRIINQYFQKLNIIKNDIEIRNKYKKEIEEEFEIIIKNKVYTEKEEAGKEILKIYKELEGESEEIGEYKGFRIEIKNKEYNKSINLFTDETMKYSKEISTYENGNIIKMNNIFDDLEIYKERYEMEIKRMKKDLEEVQKNVNKQFSEEDKLRELLLRKVEIDNQITKQVV